jgi:hypothetical protein
VTKNLLVAKCTLPWSYGYENTTTPFSKFPSPQNIDPKVSPPRKSLPIETPFVPWLGVHPPSPKSRIKPSFPSAPNIRKTEKVSCYSTKLTHLNHVLCAVIMVTHSMNRSLESQASTTTNKWYRTCTRAFPHYHEHSLSWIP